MWGWAEKTNKPTREKKTEGKRERVIERELLPNMSQFPITVPTFI